MRYIHCTQRLLKEIDPKFKGPWEERNVIGLGDWYANIFQLDEKVYLAFLNVKTLYAFIVEDIYRQEIDFFKNMFIFNLINSLELNGFDSYVIKHVVSEYSEIKCIKTNSKSYLGYVNDLIENFLVSIEDDWYRKKMTTIEFNRNIVNNPIKAFNYKTPLEKLRELVEKEIKNE
jgi:hypothetical protein